MLDGSARRLFSQEEQGHRARRSHSIEGASDTSKVAMIAFKLAYYASIIGRVEEAKEKPRQRHF